MISKAIGVLIKKNINQLRLHCGVYECTDAGGIIRNNGPTMLYLIFKIINPATKIFVSNLNG